LFPNSRGAETRRKNHPFPSRSSASLRLCG
jgi:hypothetical protein